MKRQRLSVDGLQTDPNPHSGASPGGMLKCDNAVIRRQGVAQPRPGFADTTNSVTSSVIARIIPYDGDWFVKGSTTTHQWSDGTAIFDETGSVAISTTVISSLHAVEARKNLYLSTSKYVRKLEAASDGTALPAGMPRPGCLLAMQLSGDGLSASKAVAYRIVLRHTDSNGLVSRSVPSSRAVMDNTFTTSRTVDVSVWWGAQSFVQSGDVVEVYRSAEVDSGQTPSDEMYLVQEYELQSADITSGAVDLSDDLPPASTKTGASLYASPSREGIARGNGRPPACDALELFQSSMFYANTKSVKRLRLVYKESGGSLQGTADGIGIRTVTGTRTTSSSQITALSDVTGIKAGMVVRPGAGPSWSIGTGPVRVVTVDNASTVTTNAVWTAATSTAVNNFYDAFRIKNSDEDQFYPVHYAQTASAAVGGAIGTTSSFSTTRSEYFNVYTLGTGIETDGSGVVTDPRRTLIVESNHATVGDFEVYATHGSEFDPPLPEPYTSNTSGTLTTTGEPSVQDDWPHAVYWSKANQPEHVPIANYVQMGSEKHLIMGMAATMDALFVFKTDGIWRITGHGELSGFRVDEFDLSHKAVCRSFAVMDDVVYGISSRGFFACSNAGVRLIGDPYVAKTIVSNMRRLDVADPDLSDVYGAWVAANPKDHEVLFGVPDVLLTVSKEVLVYNTKTQSWARWFPDSDTYCHAALDSDGRLLLAKRAAAVYKERDINGTTWTADLDDGVTISAVSAGQLDITASTWTAWTPAAGDLIVQGGTSRAIVSGTVVTNGATYEVPVYTDATFFAGAATAYQGFETCLEWANEGGEGPGSMKRFRNFVVHFEDLRGTYQWNGKYRSARSNSVASSSYTESLSDLDGTTGPKESKRVHINRDHSYSSQLIPQFCEQNADSRVEVSGVTIDFTPAGGRVTR